jgi:glyoxylase-like metal-dependent hydrolase (beta-lactamase superfamily II)
MFGKVLGVELIKQRSLRDCALCVVAMLTESPYESVLAHNPNYESQTDEQWIDYIRTLKFRVRRTTLILPGHRYFCIVSKETEGDPRNSHAIGIDEQGRVFDPFDSRARSRHLDGRVVPLDPEGVALHSLG